MSSVQFKKVKFMKKLTVIFNLSLVGILFSLMMIFYTGFRESKKKADPVVRTLPNPALFDR